MATRTKRRGNGEGSIYQRSDGRWCACINIGYDASGKRQRRVVYGATKKGVQDKLSKLYSDKSNGMLRKTERQTVGEYFDWWIETSKEQTRLATYVSYKGVINSHIKPLLGGKQLAKLTSDDLDNLLADMARRKLSPRLRQLTYATVRRAMRVAVKKRKLMLNPCDAVESPRVERKTMKTLEPAQVLDLLDAARADRLEALYVVAVATGLRMGELFALQWTDIDLEAGRITVRHTLTEVCGKQGLAQPKTDKGRRSVELPKTAVVALEGHRRSMLREGLAGTKFMFTNQQGNWLRRSHFHRQHFKPLLRKAGLPDMRFHDLRHTAATLMLAQGTHAKIVQERLGHSQISVTMDTYSHVLPTMQREAADRFDQYLQPKAAGA